MTRQRPDLFSQRPLTSGDYARLDPAYGRGRRAATMLVIAALIGFGLYTAFRHRAPPLPGEIPTIKADGPFKQKPENPGGIDIPNRDVQVYDELDGTAAKDNGIEHLLAPPEVPKPMATTVTPTPATPAAPMPEAQPVPPAAAPMTTVTPDKAVTAFNAVNPDEDGSAPESLLPSVQQTAPAAAPVKAPAPAPAAHGGTVIQLAAINDQGAAQAAMEKLQSRFQSILGPAQLRLVRADLGAKGIYYRIQSQGLTEAQAGAICDAVKAQHQGCLLVRP